MVELFHGVYFIQSQVLIFFNPIIYFDNPFDAWFQMLDFAQVWSGVAADVIEELILLENATRFRHHKLAHVNIGLLMCRVYCSNCVFFLLWSLFASHWWKKEKLYQQYKIY